MAADGSVTIWFDPLQAGDPAAAQELWERYFRRLVGLARKKLQGSRRRVADEEDVALSVFASLCRGAQAGRFPQLLHRDSLWALLVVITVRKAGHLIRHERCLKQGGGVAIVGEPQAQPGDEPPLEQVLSREPTPEMEAQMAEECQRLLRCLGDKELEAVALACVKGFSVKEIAEQLGYAPRSIKRKLQMIREIWERELTA
jgi:RNA polymerase sigma factor (sigma-70 family)